MPKKHYLITIDVGNAHLHSYVMTNNPANDLGRATNTMIDFLEKKDIHYFPVILQTELSVKGKTDPKSVKLVHEVMIRTGDPKVRHTLATAKNFHFCMFGIRSDDPDDKRLMALH